MSRSPLVLGGFVLALGGAMSSLYTVDAREIAVVTSFGAPVKTVWSPGSHLKRLGQCIKWFDMTSGRGCWPLILPSF